MHFRRESRESSEQLLFEHYARVAKALAQGHRMRLLALVAQSERSVERLAALAGLSVANTSKHLQQLRYAGLVTVRKQGNYAFYRLSDDAVVQLLGSLRRIAERNLAEVTLLIETCFRTRDRLEPITRAALLERMRKGQVTVIDVRPEEEYAAGHLPGAINVPLKKLQRELTKLPREREVIAYCRGPYCMMSYNAVDLLRKRGFKARRLEEGYPEWKVAGFSTETAAPAGVRRNEA